MEYGLRWLENDIIRIVIIIKLNEDRENCDEIYFEAMQRLRDAYSKWTEYEVKFHISEEQQITK